MKPSALKLWTDGTDMVIAESAEAAREIQAEQHGGRVSDFSGDFHEWPRDTFTLAYDDTQKQPDKPQIKPVSQWIAEHGRGFFASTEY